MSSVIEFPQEIFDMVIDHLHNNRRALSACSLVCRSWLPSSRHHKFASLRLRVKLDDEVGNWTPLNEWPAAAQYVRDLTLVGEIRGSLRLHDCAALHCLTLTTGVLHAHLVALPCLSSTVKILKLEWYEITNASSLVMLLYGLPCLESFWVDCVKMKDSQDGVEYPVAPAPRLSGQFHIEMSHRPMPDQIFPLTKALSSLPHGVSFESIHVICSSRNFWAKPLNSLMRACGQNLHSFICNCSRLKTATLETPVPLDFSNNPNLRYLVVPCIRDDRIDAYQMLSSISSPHMKYLELVVDGCSMDFTPSVEWNDLDDLLCGPQFSTLEIVKLRFLFQLFWNPQGDEPVIVPILLPRAASLGLLQVVDETLRTS